MIILKPTTDKVINTIENLVPREKEVVLILVGENSDINYPMLINELNKRSICFMGAIFPAVINGTEQYKDGVIVKKIPCLQAPTIVENISTGELVFPDFSFLTEKTDKKYTFFTIIDGLSNNITNYISNLYNRLGNTVSYLGAGAGSLSLVQKPCLFYKDGFVEDAALICVFDMKSKLGVRHGWDKLVGPFVATKTTGNTIIELNWQNPYEVYRDAIKKDCGKDIAKENFIDISKSYPFGMYKEGGEDIIRDPLKVEENGEIVCIGEVPENSILYIMKGDNESLIKATERATTDCFESGVKIDFEHTIIIDCITRSLFLDKDYVNELKAIEKNITSPIVEAKQQGALTLGEISSHGEGWVDFFNKTTVIGMLY